MLVEAVSVMSKSKREYRMKALFRFFSTVAIALTMGPAFFGQQGSTSKIHARITSIPTGADIKVDGAYVGTTPLEIELTCCFHDITISKRGFKPWTGMVRNNGHANVTAHLK
jgi:PEGA domain